MLPYERLEDAADIDFSAFKDPKLARGLIETIHRLAPRHATLMEVRRARIPWPSLATESVI